MYAGIAADFVGVHNAEMCVRVCRVGEPLFQLRFMDAIVRDRGLPVGEGQGNQREYAMKSLRWIGRRAYLYEEDLQRHEGTDKS